MHGCLRLQPPVSPVCPTHAAPHSNRRGCHSAGRRAAALSYNPIKSAFRGGPEQRKHVSLTPDAPTEASAGARGASSAKVSGPELSTVEKVEVQRLIVNNDSGLRARDGERGREFKTRRVGFFFSLVPSVGMELH